MTHIYFTKADFHEGLDGVHATHTDARCVADAVVALECYGNGTYPEHPRAARLWLAGAKCYLDVADYAPFVAHFGEPVDTVDRRKVIIPQRSIVAEFISDNTVECVIPCKMRNPVFVRTQPEIGGAQKGS